MCKNDDRNIDHRRWSKKCPLQEGQHKKSLFTLQSRKTGDSGTKNEMKKAAIGMRGAKVAIEFHRKAKPRA